MHMAGGQDLDLSRPGDYNQDAQNCAPYSAANCLYWISNRGFENLMPPGTELRQRIGEMADKIMMGGGGSRQFGMTMGGLSASVERYIRECGYHPSVKIRYCGHAGARKGDIITVDWLRTLDSTRSGTVFGILLVELDGGSGQIEPASPMGHAVSFVSLKGDTMRVHDPAFRSGDTGFKDVTVQQGKIFDPSDKQYHDAVYVTGHLFLGHHPNPRYILQSAVHFEVGKAAGSSLPASKESTPASAAGSSAVPSAEAAKGLDPLGRVMLPLVGVALVVGLVFVWKGLEG